MAKGIAPKGLVEIKDIDMGINTDIEEVRKNININIRRGLQQLHPYDRNDRMVIVAAGGPSLLEHFDELEEQYNSGIKVVAVNGSHDWLLDRGIRPSIHVMIDARESNVRFVGRPIASCKYFVASQAHPSIFEALKDHDLYIFHPCGEDEDEILNEYYFKQWVVVHGGSTVTLRTLFLLRVLGFYRFDIFGWDSCYMGDKHHSYPMPENENEEVKTLVCMDKEFRCAAWMASQAQDFQKFIKYLGEDYEMNVRGEGLIAHMIRAGAHLDPDKLTEV